MTRGDALEIMEDLDGDSFDLIFADAPYLLSNGGTSMSGGKRVAVDKGAWDHSSGDVEEDHHFHRAWLRRCRRLLRPSGTIWVCGNYQSICSMGWAMQQLGYHFLNMVTWIKPNPPGNLGCRSLLYSTEFLIWAATRRYKPLRHTFLDKEVARVIGGGKQLRDTWTISPPAAPEKRFGKHPAQKPEALIERCLAISSEEGDRVLDPFMGSGTTAVVAARMKRRFLGIEREFGYIKIARKRLAAAL